MDEKSSGDLVKKLKALSGIIIQNINEFNKRVVSLSKGTLKRTQLQKEQLCLIAYQYHPTAASGQIVFKLPGYAKSS